MCLFMYSACILHDIMVWIWWVQGMPHNLPLVYQDTMNFITQNVVIVSAYCAIVFWQMCDHMYLGYFVYLAIITIYNKMYNKKYEAKNHTSHLSSEKLVCLHTSDCLHFTTFCMLRIIAVYYDKYISPSEFLAWVL